MGTILNEQFADLEPIPQDDGPEPIVRIAYPEGFEPVMDYFRRILVNGAFRRSRDSARIGRPRPRVCGR